MLVGVAVMILSMPLTAAIARYQTKLQRQQMKNKDARTRIMSELLANIRSIKLYAWEDSFAQKLFQVRNENGQFDSFVLPRSLTLTYDSRARHAAQDGIPERYLQLLVVVHSLRRRVSLFAAISALHC